MSQRKIHLLLLCGTLAVAQLLTPCLAQASGLPRLKVGGDIEYLNVSPTEGGGYALRLGDQPISSARFVEAVARLDAHPALVRQVKAEQETRTALGLGTLGLVAAAPVFVGMYLVNQQRNPSGTFTRTWLALSAADAIAAAGLGTAYLIRNAGPLFGYQDAKDAARAYNMKLDRQDHTPER